MTPTWRRRLAWEGSEVQARLLSLARAYNNVLSLHPSGTYIFVNLSTPKSAQIRDKIAKIGQNFAFSMLKYTVLKHRKIMKVALTSYLESQV